jgi:hypothetical protein
MRVAHETSANEAKIEVFHRCSPPEGIIDIELLSFCSGIGCIVETAKSSGNNIGME